MIQSSVRVYELSVLALVFKGKKMMRSKRKKLIGLFIGITAVLSLNFVVLAQQDMTVYITDSGGYYHLDGCSKIKKSKIPMMLSDTYGVFDPCPVCGAPSNVDVDRNDIATETPRTETVTNTEDNTDSQTNNQTNDQNNNQSNNQNNNQNNNSNSTNGDNNEIATAESDDYSDTNWDNDSNEDYNSNGNSNSNSNSNTNDNSSSNSDSNSNGNSNSDYNNSNSNNNSNNNSETTSNSNSNTVVNSDSEIATPEEEAEFYRTHSDKDKTGKYANSNSSNSNSSNSNTSNSNSGKTNNSNTSNSNSNSTNRPTTTTSNSGSQSNSQANTSKRSDEVLSQSQRRSKYGSKTNPKRGEKPVTTPRPVSNGYMYADFATFNQYDSENHLGGTPIYILGTVTDVAAFTQNTNQYRVGVMLTDADGYQWYLRMYVAKTKFEDFKKALKGQTGCFYGGFAGYSGVMTRPMMDITVFTNAEGVSTDLSSYLL